MRIALIADVFPPLRSSGAVQLNDLSLEMANQGHKVTVIIPDHTIESSFQIEECNGVEVLRLKAPATKDIGYIRRVFNECLMPFAMMIGLKRSPLALTQWEGVVWYSPTIFLGPIVKKLKETSKCKSYLIIRDIFPAWALDMGILSKAPPYYFFKMVEYYQYSAADVIGVQTPANCSYFDQWAAAKTNRKVEVLQNWLSNSSDLGCSIKIDDTILAGRTICVYAGNMGVAQGMDVLMEAARNLLDRTDIGFLFVGRGSEADRLHKYAQQLALHNVLFNPEIDPSEIAGLYAQCHIGIVALDPRHKTQNVPGKFLSYMLGGLPVVASINPGNDLIPIIENERLGKTCSDYSPTTLARLIDDLVEELKVDNGYSQRCKFHADINYSPAQAVKKIVAQLKPSLS
jgi:glycosyltransferase involved in cell wall biosynthesis